MSKPKKYIQNFFFGVRESGLLKEVKEDLK